MESMVYCPVDDYHEVINCTFFFVMNFEHVP